jgi:hypothetical protein
MAKDYEGVYLGGGCGNLPHVVNPLQGEALAALYSLERATQLWHVKDIFGNCCYKTKKSLNNNGRGSRCGRCFI